jgi:integrase
MICHLYKQKGRRMWSGRFRLHGETRITSVSLGTSDKQVAKKRLMEKVSEIEQERAGLIPPRQLREAGQKLLTDLLDEFVSGLRKEGRADTYTSLIDFRVRRLIEECKWTRASDVTAESFTTWRNQQNCSPKTINDYLGAISSLLNWMKGQERIGKNPLAVVGEVDTTGKQRQRRAFTPEEFKRLLAVSGPRKALYVVAIHTGLRRGELAELSWFDIHLDSPQPYLELRDETTKNGKGATIPLHPDAVSVLRELLITKKTGQEFVFEHMPRIERFKRDLKKAGIPYKDAQGRFADLHALRKTFCTNLHMGGASIRVAMQLMRHSDVRLTTQTYTDSSLLPTTPAVLSIPSYL